MMALLITGLCISCKKEQTASQFENESKSGTKSLGRGSETKPDWMRSVTKKLVYEIKKQQKISAIFSELDEKSLDNKHSYLLEDKINNNSFLIKSFKSIDFSKHLISSQFVKELSLEDVFGNRYSCKISSTKQNQKYARAGMGESGEFCIDWYWIIFNEQTGEIISEIYVSTTCYDNSGGGGGGGGTNDCSNRTEEEQENIIKSLTATDPGIVEYENGTTLISRSGLEQTPRTPKWHFARIRGLFYIEYEFTAFFSGVVYRNNDRDFWKWESIKYSSSAITDGVILPCTSVDINVTATSITISGDEKEAKAKLSYVANFTIMGPLGPKATPVWGTNSKTFIAN